MSDCDKVAAVLLRYVGSLRYLNIEREDVHNVCKITFRRTESGGSTSLRDVSLKKYSSYGDFQEELESVLLSAAACHDHKSFEHLEILRILRLGTSLITALLSTNNVESEATGKRKEKKANGKHSPTCALYVLDIRPSPLSNIQKVAMYKQDFDGSYNFSSTLPAFLLDLGQSTGVSIETDAVLTIRPKYDFNYPKFRIQR
ncbi:hypothetical protein BC829DRAFT_391667 [Chytridium lagenaria]|nr:hypothetical protein BC829DRAFT_391667 [Chytridium lagenaria]